jgi:tRNA A-37 threonylcarbamoyl transferase component Bud32
MTKNSDHKNKVSLNEEFQRSEEQAPSGLVVDIIRGVGLLRLLPAFTLFTLRHRGLKKSTEDYQPHEVPADFVGINIAPGSDESFDDYLLERLAELGVQSLRIDYGYSADNQENVGRLIPKLHERGYRILLHLVQPVDDAWRAHTNKVNKQWETFVDDALTRFKEMIVAVELASTPNRFSWAGYRIKGFVKAVVAGARVCDQHGVPWHGPNVSDFCPVYNVGILSQLWRKNALPAAHTNNLFVDRGGQPENNDAKVSPFLTSFTSFDLVGKAKYLHVISRYYSIKQTISTYNYWTLNNKSKNKPRYVSEEQFARYLFRYGVLAAASGHLDRIYWGQMISHAKGLIGDGTGVLPRIPTVHHQWELLGDWRNYRIRPGFHAMAALNKTIAESQFVARLPTDENVFAFEFERKQGEEKNARRFIVGWTRDHLGYSLEPWFNSEANKIITAKDMYGKTIESPSLELHMEPVTIEYSGPSVVANHHEESSGYLGGIPVPASAKHPYRLFTNENYRGIIREDMLTDEVLQALENPELLLKNKNVRIVKDSARNMLAELAISSLEGDRRVYFKAFKKNKLFSDRIRSRAFKAWSNINKILYRDINTPHPIALIENASDPCKGISYLIVESAENTHSLRSILDCVRKKKDLPFPGVDADEFLRQFGIFSREMHRSGIWHRDYTGGNVLVGKELRDGKLDFTLIDIARARFYRRVSYLKCFLDLSRVRISTKDRKTFFDAYIEVKEHPKRAKYWKYYRLIHFLYRTKYNLRKPKRLLKAIRGEN